MDDNLHQVLDKHTQVIAFGQLLSAIAMFVEQYPAVTVAEEDGRIAKRQQLADESVLDTKVMASSCQTASGKVTAVGWGILCAIEKRFGWESMDLLFPSTPRLEDYFFQLMLMQIPLPGDDREIKPGFKTSLPKRFFGLRRSRQAPNFAKIRCIDEGWTGENWANGWEDKSVLRSRGTQRESENLRSLADCAEILRQIIHKQCSSLLCKIITRQLSGKSCEAASVQVVQVGTKRKTCSDPTSESHPSPLAVWDGEATRGSECAPKETVELHENSYASFDIASFYALVCREQACISGQIMGANASENAQQQKERAREQVDNLKKLLSASRSKIYIRPGKEVEILECFRNIQKENEFSTVFRSEARHLICRMQFLDALLRYLLELADQAPKIRERLRSNTVALIESFSSIVSWRNDEILNVHARTIKELRFHNLESGLKATLL